MNGTVNVKHSLTGVVRVTNSISGKMPVQSGRGHTETDHEVIAVDLYQLNDTNITPTTSNAVLTLSETEIQPTISNAVVNLTATELQTETITIEGES